MMTMMNYFCAKSLLEKREGLFRNSVLKNDNINISQELPEEVSNFIKIWYSSGGQYINAASLEDDVSLVRHELMDMDAYIHITSPIRRLVDLLNMIKFQQIHSLVTLSSQCYEFYKRWTNSETLEYINTSMRSIRKIQSDCSMIEYYTDNTDVTEKEYDGVMFDKVVRHDDMYKYVVYLSELKLTMRVYIPNDFPNFTRKKFKIFLFHDEDTLKKKIRLQLMET
jgi:exoribonuclease R